MRHGITFDTGALIALERRSQRARRIVERAAELRVRIVVPAVIMTEWWRGRTDLRVKIAAAVLVEPLSDALARLAGEAVAAVKSATAVDAILMASAAQRGDLVYTSDVEDLERLRSFFPAVRVLAIS